MAKQTINVGSNANDGTGDPLRTAFRKINDNFDELFGDGSTVLTLTAPNLLTPTMTGTATIDNILINDSEISTPTNAKLHLNPGGSGTIELEAATNVTGALDVTGAVTLDTSLTLAAGATITEFSTSTALGTSNTVVPTQNAVKTYIDAQNVAQAITFVGDDSTGTAVNSGETFQILGGTGLTSAVSGDALTLNIDATVATLTGAQTLTNKILTSPTIGGHAVIEGVTPTGATGTGNLVFSASPTLTGTLSAATITASGTLSVTGNTTIGGTLGTADITTTGSQTVTGNITVAGEVRTDKIKSPATNANLEIAAQGTGVVDIQSALTTIGQTITGTASVTGQFNADNLSIDGNTLSSTNTNGNITLTPNGSGQIVLSSERVAAYQLNAVTVSLSEKIDTNKIASFSSNADIVLEPQGTGRIKIVGLGLDTDSVRSTSSNADLVISTQGTGTIDLAVPTQSSVGAAGGASALPATPSGYIKIKISGVTYVIPYYAQA